jgi:hypothetical protein
MRNIIPVLKDGQKCGYVQRVRDSNGRVKWQAYNSKWGKIGTPYATVGEAEAAVNQLDLLL